MLSVKKLPWGVLRIPRRLMRQAQIAETFPQSCRRGFACGGNSRAVGNASCNGGSRGETAWAFHKEKTTSQDESDTAEERAEEAELHEEMSEFPDSEENLISDLPTSVPQVSEADEADWGFGSRSRKEPLQNLRRMNTWQQVTLKRLMHRMKRANARFSTSWTSTNWIGG